MSSLPTSSNLSESAGVVSGIRPFLKHPKRLSYPEIMKYAGVKITNKEELSFFEDMPVGSVDETSHVSSDRARRLMELLNRYRIGSGWSCNPGKRNTTAFFKLLYKGNVRDMPDEYKFNHSGQLVVIVELTTLSGPAVYSLLVG